MSATLLIGLVTAGCGGGGETGTEPEPPLVATRLEFVNAPGHAVPGNRLDVPVQVAVRDAQGRLVTTYSDSIHLALLDPVLGLRGSWSGSPVVPVAGIAMFEFGPMIKGEGYRYVAYGGPLVRDTSEAFDAFYFQTLEGGDDHFCVITDLTRTWCWGRNDAGQLGDGSTSDRSSPVRVAGDLTFDSLTAGSRHTCALLADGAARCWGDNTHGQLGDGTTAARSVPVAVSGDGRYLDISAGGAHTCAIAIADSTAWCWGWGAMGEAGSRTAPTRVSESLKFVELASRDTDTCGRTPAAGVHCWGADLVPTWLAYGQSDATSIWAGRDRQCFMRSSYELRCWRSDPGTQEVVTVPAYAWQFRIGAEHACFVVLYAVSHCWGNNGVGQVGDGTRTPRSAPVDIQALLDHYASYKIAVSRHATCVAAGAMRCWGSNAYGQLGVGRTAYAGVGDRDRPTGVRFP